MAAWSPQSCYIGIIYCLNVREFLKPNHALLVSLRNVEKWRNVIIIHSLNWRAKNVNCRKNYVQYIAEMSVAACSRIFGEICDEICVVNHYVFFVYSQQHCVAVVWWSNAVHVLHICMFTIASHVAYQSGQCIAVDQCSCATLNTVNWNIIATWLAV